MLNDRQLIPDDTPPLPGETVRNNRPIPVHTLFGTITLKRRYFHHANSHCGRAPLDLILDVTEHHTPALAQLICQASANAGDSYQEAAGILSVFTGLKLEARSFHRLINRLTPELLEALPSLAPTAVTKPIPILYLETDGTGVPCRPEELAGRPCKQPDGTARTREAKLGCVFTQTSTDAEGNPMRDPDSTSYVGTMGDCRAIYGVGEFAAAQQKIWATELKSSDVQGILEQAGRLLAANPDLDEQRQETARREIAYFTTHIERTRYGYFRLQGYFIGSGVIEAGCKTVIGRRLKQSGMFWERKMLRTSCNSAACSKAHTSKPPGKPGGRSSSLDKLRPDAGPRPHNLFVIHPSQPLR